MKQFTMQQQHRRSPQQTGNNLLTRRAFLKLTGTTFLVTAAGCASRVAPSVSTPSARGPTVEIVLTAQEASWELAPGKRITAWTYNGTVPGHPIRVREGDHVRVVFTNRLSEPTTIHWHGVDVPASMDGVPDLSQRAIQPGATFTYEFGCFYQIWWIIHFPLSNAKNKHFRACDLCDEHMCAFGPSTTFGLFVPLLTK